MPFRTRRIIDQLFEDSLLFWLFDVCGVTKDILTQMRRTQFKGQEESINCVRNSKVTMPRLPCTHWEVWSESTRSQIGQQTLPGSLLEPCYSCSPPLDHLFLSHENVPDAEGESRQSIMRQFWVHLSWVHLFDNLICVMGCEFVVL